MGGVRPLGYRVENRKLVVERVDIGDEGLSVRLWVDGRSGLDRGMLASGSGAAA